MAPHSSALAWRIPWTEEPGGLQSVGSQRVGHDWATSLALFTFMHWRRKWRTTPVFLPGKSQGRGAWWAAVYGVTQSQTRLKRLSSSSRSWSHIPGHRRCLPNVLAYSEGKATLPTVDGVQGLTRMTSHTALAWGDCTESLCIAVKGWAHCGRPDAS